MRRRLISNVKCHDILETSISPETRLCIDVFSANKMVGREKTETACLTATKKLKKGI